MIEKSSKIALTCNDILFFNKGILSDRVKTLYQINSLAELKMVIDNNEYDYVDSSTPLQAELAV